MITLLSPAKSLDLETKIRHLPTTQPRFLAEVEELVGIMQGMTPADLRTLMGISDDLAALNATRYAEFALPLMAPQARPALFTFNGDVYQGMRPRERFTTDDLTESTKTLRILSGLYGILRPLDLMNAYRLEMGVKLVNPAGKDLYSYWRPRFAPALREDLDASPGSDTLVNLSSNEYFGAVDAKAIGAAVVSPRFEDRNSKGEWKVMSFTAKRARGMMAGWIVSNRVHTPLALREFDEAGYRYVPEVSTHEVPVFRREK